MIKSAMLWFTGLILLLQLGCNEQSAVSSRFFADQNPVKLSAWRLLLQERSVLRTADDVQPYFLASSLFTDYAQKLRTLTLPQGHSVAVTAEGKMQFPFGTIISKTFYYSKLKSSAGTIDGFVKVAENFDGVSENKAELDLDRVFLVETRLLVRRTDGWHALPYVWDKDQKDATLRIAGTLLPVELQTDGQVYSFVYVVPNQNQCAGCHALDHASKQLEPIGPHARHINRRYPGSPYNQLSRWQVRGWLSETAYQAALGYPRNPDWQDDSVPLETRARSYLDINCGHCHSKTGPADTSGLFLETSVTDPLRWGLCKAPVAAGQGTGGNQFSVVPGQPGASILAYRMTSLDPGVMMPELGRSLVHREGLSLIRDWIQSMPGECASHSSIQRSLVQAH